MTRRLISSGSTFEKAIGYSRVVVDGEWIFVSGTTGFDYAKMSNGGDFPECWPVLKKYFGEVRPAAMMNSAGRADPRMRIEIEVTALKRQPG